MQCGDPRVKRFLRVAPHRTSDLHPACWLRGDASQHPDAAAGTFRLGNISRRATASCRDQAGQGAPVGGDRLDSPAIGRHVTVRMLLPEEVRRPKRPRWRCCICCTAAVTATRPGLVPPTSRSEHGTSISSSSCPTVARQASIRTGAPDPPGEPFISLGSVHC